MSNERDRLLEALSSDGSICRSCAEGNGATWPKGHCATFWGGPCCICLKKASCCAVSDYDWPNKNIKLDREL